MKKLTTTHFLKWILAKLDEPAIIVITIRASTVSRYKNLFPAPAEYDSRQSMISWLHTQGIEHGADLFKPELYKEFMTIETDVWKEHFDRIVDVDTICGDRMGL